MATIHTRIGRLAVGVWLLLNFPLRAQELNCQVQINADQLMAQQKMDPTYVGQLKTFITEFMNNRRWTDDQYAPNERINCILSINLVRTTSVGVFEGTAQVVANRPVYGSAYETTTLSYVDRSFNFSYLPTVPLTYRENQYSDELTSMLAYYANIILAVDYDSFSKEGGSPYVQRAFAICNQAFQATGSATWMNTGDRRNRYWLVENLQNQQLLPFRDGFYQYHRRGLDMFASKPAQTRQETLELLNTIRTIGLQMPNSVLISSFFDAKGVELFNILYEGTPAERKRAYELLSYLDPAKTETYKKLIESGS